MIKFSEKDMIAYTKLYGDSPGEIYKIPNSVYGDVVEITLEGKNIENTSVIYTLSYMKIK
jgi:hypothetical protein